MTRLETRGMKGSGEKKADRGVNLATRCACLGRRRAGEAGPDGGSSDINSKNAGSSIEKRVIGLFDAKSMQKQ
jgi:hypothetical protein